MYSGTYVHCTRVPQQSGVCMYMYIYIYIYMGCCQMFVPETDVNVAVVACRFMWQEETRPADTS